MKKNLVSSLLRGVFMSTLEKPDRALYPTINWEKILPYLTKIVIWLRSHKWLLFVGITSEAVYFFYLLHDFPVIRYTLELTDMGALNNYSHYGCFKFLIAFTILFILFGFAWWETRNFHDRATLWAILSFSSIFALTAIFVYPVTAIDIFNYIVQSLVLVQYGANPMITPPSHFAPDPLMQLAGGFVNVPSPYGPLAQVLQAALVAIGGRNVLFSLLLLKFSFSAMLIVEAFFIYKIFSHIAPKFALSGTLALAWNPFALFEYSANGHNDIAMTLFIILAAFALMKEHHIWALMLVTTSALIKFSSLPLIPLFFIYSFTHQPTIKKCIFYSIVSIIGSSAIVLTIWAYFWAGPDTLMYLLNVTHNKLYSFSMFVQDFSSNHISFNNAELIGWVLFTICFAYAMWLSSRHFSSMLKGCAITTFALLAFSATYVQVWYLIWPLALALLIPRTEVSLAAILFSYGGILVELVHTYIFPWGAFYSPDSFAIVNSMAYFVIFVPPMLLLFVFQLRQIFRQIC
jgi:hypothetical protein